MESLLLSVLCLNMQAATFELVRDPVDLPFDWRNAYFWIVFFVL